MDEVDGMAGNEDRGGVAELILLIKSSKIPVICMCNDRNHPKIRSLANHCFDLRFQRPRIEQIRVTEQNQSTSLAYVLYVRSRRKLVSFTTPSSIHKSGLFFLDLLSMIRWSGRFIRLFCCIRIAIDPSWLKLIQLILFQAAMMSICFKEKVKISPDALNELISGCNQVTIFKKVVVYELRDNSSVILLFFLL